MASSAARWSVCEADGAGAQAAGEGVGVDFDADAVRVGQPLRCQYVCGVAVRDDPPRVQQQDPVGDGGRLVEVVQDGSDGDPVVVRQVPHEVEEFDLVAQVEVVRRLVEQEHARLLGEAAGEPDALELAAGQVFGAPFGEVRDAGHGEGTVDRGPAARVGPAPAAPVRVATEFDDVPHGQSAGRGAALGEQRDVPGELAGAQGQAVGLAVDDKGGGPGPLEARERAQQRRLPAAVRTDQHGHLARAQRHRGVVDDVDAFVRHGDTRGRQFMTLGARGLGGLFTNMHASEVSLT